LTQGFPCAYEEIEGKCDLLAPAFAAVKKLENFIVIKTGRKMYGKYFID
jgi:hypothetical protein